MADKDKGNLRKRLVRDHEQKLGADSEAEYAKLASELAGTVGETVEKATQLGLGVVEDVVLKMMEVFSPSKPVPGRNVMGVAASVLASTRAKAPEVTGKAANRLTKVIVGTGFEVLRTIHHAVRNTRRPG